MKKNLAAILALTLVFFGFMGCGKSYQGPPADLVIKNAKIVTIDKDNPLAEAVAVKSTLNKLKRKVLYRFGKGVPLACGCLPGALH